MSASIKPQPSWHWLSFDQAAQLAADRSAVTEALRAGHGLLSRELFVNALQIGEIEILLLPGGFAALCTWGECDEGLTLNVLTVTGTLEHARLAFEVLEIAARHSEAAQIISIGHPGWRALVESIGYTTNMRLFMRKVLT